MITSNLFTNILHIVYFDYFVVRYSIANEIGQNLVKFAKSITFHHSFAVSTINTDHECQGMPRVYVSLYNNNKCNGLGYIICQNIDYHIFIIKGKKPELTEPITNMDDYIISNISHDFDLSYRLINDVRKLTAEQFIRKFLGRYSRLSGILGLTVLRWQDCRKFRLICTQIARLIGPTWEPPGSCRLQVGPTLAPWTLLSG